MGLLAGDDIPGHRRQTVGYRPSSRITARLSTAWECGVLQVFHPLRDPRGRYVNDLDGYIGLVQVNEGCCQFISRRWSNHGSSLQSGVGAFHRLRALVSVLRREARSARLPRVEQRIHEEGRGFLPRRRLPRAVWILAYWGQREGT